MRRSGVLRRHPVEVRRANEALGTAESATASGYHRRIASLRFRACLTAHWRALGSYLGTRWKRHHEYADRAPSLLLTGPEIMASHGHSGTPLLLTGRLHSMVLAHDRLAKLLSPGE